MTNPIGQGTTNVSVNLRQAERNLLGRLAHEDDRSIGSLVRRLILRGLEVENPELAAKLREIRQGIGRSACLALGLLAVGLALNGGMDIRRTSTRIQIRPRREEVA